MSSKANKYLLLVFTLILMSSCGGKKKLIQKSQFSTEIAKVERVNELTENSTVKESLTVQKKESESSVSKENLQAEINDPSKPASIKKTEKDGETVWELDNIKNFNSGRKKKSEKSKDSLGQNLSKIELSKSAKNSETDLKIDASGSEKIVDKQKDGRFTWWWLILIALSIAIYLWIGKLKKTYMPWKWFTS
ncbi:hypothetical protein [Xanthomarina gelatinilytica]|uniref:hypothetical protein n=1 Tax=Xanthomarina gelatinilytica TaxID=1137281 RepID=UPI003AA9960C